MTKGRLAAPEIRWACLFALAVALIRLWLARPLRFCGTPDACYYLGMGQTLAAGRGFQARFLYDFQLAHPTLPNTGIEYWRPGISLLLQGLRPLGGVGLHSSISLTILVGLLYAAAAWHLAMQHRPHRRPDQRSDQRLDHRPDRRIALEAFALCLVAAPVWTGSLTPDSGLYYGAAVAWFLALFTVQRQGLLADLLALCCVAAAYLIRNDAALLLIPLLAVLWRRRQNQQADLATLHGGSSAVYVAAMLLGFGLALLPMHLLYRAVLGTAFPSGTAQAFFLDNLGDFVHYGEPVGPHTLFAHGLKHLLLFRVSTLVTALYRMAALVIGYAGLIFLPGLLLRNPKASPGSPAAFPQRKPALPELTGPAAFFAILLAVYMVLLPAIGGFSILRSVLGILPVLTLLIVLGIHRSARDPQVAAVLSLMLIGTNLVGGIMETRREVEAANLIGDADRAAAQSLAASGASPSTAVIMTPDPVQFSVTTGYTALALPSNGLDAIARAAGDFGATHVILNTDDLPAPSKEITSQLHPVRTQWITAGHLTILSLPTAPAALPSMRSGTDH